MEPQATELTIPPQTREAMQMAEIPLYIILGPPDAVLQTDQLPIALNSIWDLAPLGTNAGGLAQQITTFALRGRKIYLAFAANPTTDPNVRHALVRTGVNLIGAGADVALLRWEPAGGKSLQEYLTGQTSTKSATTLLEELTKDASPLSDAVVESDGEMVELELAQANLRPLRLHSVCKLFGPALKIAAARLEQAVTEEAESESVTSYLKGLQIQPWPDPVNGVDLVDEIMRVINAHVVMTDAKALATGLWVLMTYLPNSIDTMPLLSICSPQKRCGKSTLLQLLTQLCYRPLPSSNISMAGIYRGIDLMHPTLLIDECDQWLRREKDAIGVLNSGHNRAMAHILRADGNTLRNFSTWSPKALAGIGMLSTHADTLSDRSIIVTLDRRRKNQTITPLRSAPAGQFERMLDRSLPGPNRMPKI
jgi:hypothetical protein